MRGGGPRDRQGEPVPPGGLLKRWTAPWHQEWGPSPGARRLLRPGTTLRNSSGTCTLQPGTTPQQSITALPCHVPCVCICPSPQDHSSPFGRGYICDIADTVTSATDASAGSLEYLVGLDVLEAAAADAGLFPVRDYEEPILSSNFEQVGRVWRAGRNVCTARRQKQLAPGWGGLVAFGRASMRGCCRRPGSGTKY